MSDCGLRRAQTILGAWARETFPNQTAGALIAHIREEAEEIKNALNREAVAEEAADLAILLLVLADHEGFSLYEAISAKHTINLGRTWGPPDSSGIHHHEERP